MSIPRFLGLLALTATLACGSDAPQFPGSGGGGTGGTATGSGGGTGGGDPCDCGDDGYIPVCGEDGMTYDAVCGEACVPVPIDCDGECPCNATTCADLETQYADALAKAKECSPMLPVEQCLSKANDALACPCPTFVNEGDGKQQMDQLQQQWDALDCGMLVNCPEIACPEPAAAQCTPSSNGTGGVCSDLFASP